METLTEFTPETKRTLVGLIDSRIEEKLKDQLPTREDFSELKSIVQELAKAQGRTEKRVEELVHAQGRTEKRVEGLAHSQQELAQAQGRTEKRVEDLAHSQQELAQAQKRTEKELRNLARQVGGLSDRMGGSLEDLSYDVLPACIEKYHGIEVDELGRDFIRVDGKEVEVNVFGKGKKIKTGKELTIIGEVKSNITLKEVDRFLSLLKKVGPTIKEDIFTLLFGFRIHLDAREKAKKQGVHLFVSYGKEL
jgi:plasmid maintenance system antidote protein VapI